MSVRFSFTDDQRAFASGLHDLLSGEFPTARLREMWEAGEGHSPELWARLAEMGVLAILVPEDDGGMGASFTDAVLLFEQLGRFAVPGPVVEHMVAAPLLSGGPSAAGIDDGSAVVTAALDGDPFVAHADVATVIVGPSGVRTGFTAARVESIDEGRHLCTVSGGEVLPVAGAATLGDRLAVACAAYLVGLGATMIDIAGEYARQREQFGKPIGAFQAVKHLLADALLKVEFAKAPTYRAAWSLATDQPTVGRDAAMAKALAGEAAYRASRAAMQVHGGIGYTWEADLQLFMKKAWALQRAYGDSRTHRRRVADAVLGPR